MEIVDGFLKSEVYQHLVISRDICVDLLLAMIDMKYDFPKLSEIWWVYHYIKSIVLHCKFDTKITYILSHMVYSLATFLRKEQTFFWVSDFRFRLS